MYGIMFSYSGVSSAIMLILQSVVDQDTVAQYNGLFIIMGILNIVALLLLFLSFD